MSEYKSLSRRGIALVAGLFVVLVMGVSAVAAQQLVHTDKRINQIADFGGDALYCVDKFGQPTNDTKNWDHFLLLTNNGQPLWTLSRSIVEEGLGQISYGAKPVQLGNGHGRFGEINLYANANADGTPYFIFTGYDDHFKPNWITFLGCTPVGSALTPPATQQPS